MPEELDLPIEHTDTAPTFPLTDVQKLRASELADRLWQAQTQGYIEASVLVKLLDLVKEVLPLITGGIK